MIEIPDSDDEQPSGAWKPPLPSGNAHSEASNGDDDVVDDVDDGASSSGSGVESGHETDDRYESDDARDVEPIKAGREGAMQVGRHRGRLL